MPFMWEECEEDEHDKSEEQGQLVGAPYGDALLKERFPLYHWRNPGFVTPRHDSRMAW